MAVDQNDLDRWLTLLAEWEGSDLHIKAGAPPRVRIDGDLRVLPDEKDLDPEEMLLLMETVLPPRAGEIFERHHEVDFAYSVAGIGRFRVNAFYQRSHGGRSVPASAADAGLCRGARAPQSRL